MTGGLDDSTRPVDGVEPGDETTAVSRRGSAADVMDDGSTVVARRESRRRQQRAEPGRDPGVQADVEVPAPGVRVAHVPQSTPVPMPVRTPMPVIVPRAAPVARAPQDVIDTAGVQETRRRRSRRVAAGGRRGSIRPRRRRVRGAGRPPDHALSVPLARLPPLRRSRIIEGCALARALRRASAWSRAVSASSQGTTCEQVTPTAYPPQKRDSHSAAPVDSVVKPRTLSPCSAT